MLNRIIGIIAVGVFFLTAAPVYAGVDPRDLCIQKKSIAAGKKAFDILKAFSKNRKKPNTTKLDADISKAQSKFTKFFSKADALGGVSCPVTGDAGDVELAVDDCVGGLFNMISGGIEPPTSTTTTTTTTSTTSTTLRFVDNGDGTITDNQTGLMWEKKDDAGGIHYVNNKYTWSPGSPWDPDGTAFTVFLPTLNDTCDSDESTPCTDDSDCTGIGNGLCGHAGYRDWRLPNEDGCDDCHTGSGGSPQYSCPCEPAELESILLEPYPCGPSPCVDSVFNTGCTGGCTVTECSCTASYDYWSGSTTYSSFPSYAWYVSFYGGYVDLSFKYHDAHVRAVRGGS